MPSSSASAAPSRDASSTVTEIETSEVVTRSTTTWWRPNTSNTRARKPCASSMRLEAIVTAVTPCLQAIDLTRHESAAGSASATISEPGSAGSAVLSTRTGSPRSMAGSSVFGCSTRAPK